MWASQDILSRNSQKSIFGCWAQKNKDPQNLEYWSDDKIFFRSSLDQLYEQNMQRWANSEGVTFQVG